MADQPTLKMLRKMKGEGDLEKGVLLFVSDHGFPRGPFAETRYAEMDNNLPFLFVSFPSWFERQFPRLVANVRLNAKRLVTAYDIHKTLRHLLHLQTEEKPWRNDDDRIPDINGLVPPKSFSLLTEIPLDRTCATAGIPDEYCGCAPLEELDLDSLNSDVTVAKNGALTLINVINAFLNDFADICFHWKFKKILKAKKVPKKRKFMVRVEATAFDKFRNYDAITAIFNGWLTQVTKEGEGDRKGKGEGKGESEGEGKGGRDGKGKGERDEKGKGERKGEGKGKREGEGERQRVQGVRSANGFTVRLIDVSRFDRYGASSACVLYRSRAMEKICRCKRSN